MDKALVEVGVLANAAFVLGLTAGRHHGDAGFGWEVSDADGRPHPPLTRMSHIVRKASRSKLRDLRDQFAQDAEVFVADYPEEAATPSYEQYAAALGAARSDTLSYRAIYLFGPSVKIAAATKNLSRL